MKPAEQGLMEALNKVDPIKRSPDAFVLIQVIFTLETTQKANRWFL